MELTPGIAERAAGRRTAGRFRAGRSRIAVQLSDIFDALDPTTRHAFQVWQQQLANGGPGRNDQNLNDVLGNLPQFTADATDIFKVLDVEHSGSVVRLRAERRHGVHGALPGSVGASQPDHDGRDDVRTRPRPATTSFVSQSFHVFPTFLSETKADDDPAEVVLARHRPAVKELEPVAQQLKPTLRRCDELSPDLRRLFEKLGPLITASKTGLPAVSQRADRSEAAARLARPVPRAAQPDPRLALAATSS